jgi:2-phosphosulfolactate phosphatase
VGSNRGGSDQRRLRNRQAVADWLLARRREHPDLVVAVVAAGERWPDGTLRPAVEDLWGAGALIQSLRAGGWGHVSPEAHAAAAAFAPVADDLATALSTCASGRELLEIGYQDDVLAAGELDQGRCVPSLHAQAFHPMGPPGR